MGRGLCLEDGVSANASGDAPSIESLCDKGRLGALIFRADFIDHANLRLGYIFFGNIMARLSIFLCVFCPESGLCIFAISKMTVI